MAATSLRCTSQRQRPAHSRVGQVLNQKKVKNVVVVVAAGSQMTVEKPKPTLSLRPITTGEACVINQSEFLAITCYKAQEKSLVKGALGFGFASHWLKHWRETFKPIT